tara:strand:+ start:176 stop:502 length:327 start_codon:yes stop_codon:yes gene_type:complete
MKELSHICYDVTLDKLIEHYVGLNYRRDTVVVIHNPSKYTDILDQNGLYYDESEISFDQIMIVVVETPGDGVDLIKNINPNSGPICSLWVEGYYITDNIENEITNYAI